MEPLKHTVVRDLVSVMAAPSLMTSGEISGGERLSLVGDEDCAFMLEKAGAQILELDRNPAPLLEWLEASEKSPLLGRYFEALVGYWISRVMGARRMEAGIKVLRSRAVIGELDFVFEDLFGKPQHWEVSVKFYLCTAKEPEGGRQASAFLGTMTRDRLDLKMERVFGAQLGRAHTVEGLAALRAAGFGGAEPLSRALFKGALFYPAEGDWRNHPHPPQVSPTHLRGWWSAALPEGSGPQSRWVVLDRRRWLSPVLLRDGELMLESQVVRHGEIDADGGILTHTEMAARAARHFETLRTAFMVAEVRREGDYWVEHTRGLVVHPGWPWPRTGSTPF